MSGPIGQPSRPYRDDGRPRGLVHLSAKSLRAHAMRQDGVEHGAIAKHLGVSHRTVTKYLGQVQDAIADAHARGVAIDLTPPPEAP